ncbi:hypothetical protein IE53DRAFT_95089 [Violaceomyces palustris]|uniref:Uncharacterized protein n=1 Tax=Violaceomyces palustris TaxID=1673888 RepID=A0ACD0NX97_9BASI|nr:hypothetical protein IE53DRAFT_95089 [Violaceomyces palustris]
MKLFDRARGRELSVAAGVGEFGLRNDRGAQIAVGRRIGRCKVIWICCEWVVWTSLCPPALGSAWQFPGRIFQLGASMLFLLFLESERRGWWRWGVGGRGGGIWM